MGFELDARAVQEVLDGGVVARVGDRGHPARAHLLEALVRAARRARRLVELGLALVRVSVRVKG